MQDVNKSILSTGFKLCFSSHLGIVVHICGESAIRFRPSLILLPKHANLFLNTFEDELQAIT